MKEKLSKIFDGVFYTLIALAIFLVFMVGSGKAVRNEFCWKVIQSTIGDNGYRWLYNRILILEGRYYAFRGDWQVAHDKYLEAYGYNNAQKGLFGEIWSAQLKLLRSKEAYSDWIFYHKNTSLKTGTELNRGAEYEALEERPISSLYLDYVIENKNFKDVAYLERGKNLYMEGQYAAAEMDFNRAIYRNKDFSLAYFYRGRVRSILGNWKGAEADYIKAEELEPGSSIVLEKHAANLMRLKEWDKALQKVNTAMLYRPDDSELYLGRSRIKFALGEVKEAYQDLAKSERLSGKTNWLLSMTKGYYKELTGDREEAWNYYRQADALLEKADRNEPLGGFSGILAKEIAKKRTLKQPLVMDHPYNLEQLLEEVVKERFQGDSMGINSIAWTKVPNDEYYGVTTGYTGDIKISCYLNSTQVPRECVKYVIYHEVLHAKCLVNHNSHFYYMESQYPNAEKWNKLLDYKMVYCYEPKL